MQIKKVGNFFSLVPIRLMKGANMFPDDEITEATVIVKQKKRRPSFWINLATLTLLAAIILFAQKMSQQWIHPSLPEEEMEKEIVLEDLETEKPLIESESVEVPSVVVEPETLPKPAPKKAVVKPVKKISPYTKDPYTDGGTLDLDRRENWDKFFPNRPKEGFAKKRVPVEVEKQEATATPLLPTERDQFIPFEQE